MTRRLLIFCGLPGSGKTTVAREVARSLRRAVHVQTDAVRAMVTQRRFTPGESRFVYRAAIETAREALKADYDVILDGTFPREEFRREAIHELSRYSLRQMVVHTVCDPQLAYSRNAHRSEVVPRESFLRLRRQFEAPSHALLVDTGRMRPEDAARSVLEALEGG